MEILSTYVAYDNQSCENEPILTGIIMITMSLQQLDNKSSVYVLLTISQLAMHIPYYDEYLLGNLIWQFGES